MSETVGAGPRGTLTASNIPVMKGPVACAIRKLARRLEAKVLTAEPRVKDLEETVMLGPNPDSESLSRHVEPIFAMVLPSTFHPRSVEPVFMTRRVPERPGMEVAKLSITEEEY